MQSDNTLYIRLIIVCITTLYAIVSNDALANVTSKHYQTEGYDCIAILQKSSAHGKPCLMLQAQSYC